MDSTERIRSLDALRGLALFGICIVNLPLFARSWESFYQPPKDIWAQVGILINSGLFDGKFFPVFSFLFGAGMHFLLRHGTTLVLIRRLAGLFVLGVAHGFLLFTGDILVSYALLGFLFLFLRNRSARSLVLIAAACLMLSGVAYFILGLYSQTPPSIPPTNYLGTYRDVLNSNATVYPLSLAFVALYNIPAAFAMFCLGYLVLREGWLGRLRATRWTFALLIAGLAGNLFYAAATAFHQKQIMPWAMLALAWTAPLLSTAYVQLMLSWANSGVVAAPLRLLAAAGEMSLTNYLMQSLIAGILFHGYGFALYNKYSMAGLLLVSTAIYAGQVTFSVVWLKFFRCGPAEWLLRTFARWQPVAFLR